MNKPSLKKIDGYSVVRLIGKGGMAEVYEVEHERLGVRRAMKVFTADGERADFLRSRFLAEGRLLARLDHPRIVKVYDCGVDEATGHPYLTMDLVLGSDGEPHTLSSLHKERQITEEKLLGWYGDMVEALAYIHSAGVVHRDVKPSNILVASDGHAVLSDFGVSRVSDERLRGELSLDATMVTDATALSRVVLGTANYFAPEIRRGGVATESSDMYALGVTFFRLLTGVWYEPDSNALSLLDEFDPAWREVFSALLAEDSSRRSLPAMRRHPRRRFVRMLILIASVLAVIAAGVLLWSLREVPPDRSVDDIFFVL